MIFPPCLDLQADAPLPGPIVREPIERDRQYQCLRATVRPSHPNTNTLYTAVSLTGSGFRLTVILVSHFLLDLQRANCRSVDVGMFLLSYSETDTQSDSTVVFERRIVGSMGASLVIGSMDETEDSDYSH